MNAALLLPAALAALAALLLPLLIHLARRSEPISPRCAGCDRNPNRAIAFVSTNGPC